MTDPSPHTSASPDAGNPNIKNQAMIVWGLYLASILVGITALVGVILAYIWRADAANSVFADHFAKQITTFWITLIAVVISIPLMLIGVGFLTLFAAVVYFLVISVLGIVRANESRPYSRP